MGNALILLFPPLPISSSPPLPLSSFLPSLPCREAAPENQQGGLWERWKLPSGVRNKDPVANTVWYILSSKIAPDGNGFYKRSPKKKMQHCCICEKCRNGVERSSGTSFRFNLNTGWVWHCTAVSYWRFSSGWGSFAAFTSFVAGLEKASVP